MRRRVSGNDDELTLVAVNNLAMTHQDMRNFAAALPLMQESLDGSHRTQGSDSINTIYMYGTSNLAVVHGNMGNHDLAPPLSMEALETCRRVFGSQHPQTHESAGNMGVLLLAMDDDAAAAPLLREAVQGLTAVYGAEHRLVQHYQGQCASAWRSTATASRFMER